MPRRLYYRRLSNRRLYDRRLSNRRLYDRRKSDCPIYVSPSITSRRINVDRSHKCNKKALLYKFFAYIILNFNLYSRVLDDRVFQSRVLQDVEGQLPGESENDPQPGQESQERRRRRRKK